MKLKLTIKQSNPDFDKKYANQYHEGKQSNENRKDIFSKGFTINSEIDKIILEKNINHTVLCEINNGEKIEVDLPNMTVLKCYLKGKPILEVLISSELIQKILHPPFNVKNKLERYYFYIKPRFDYTEFEDFFYMINKDIPKELL